MEEAVIFELVFDQKFAFMSREENAEFGPLPYYAFNINECRALHENAVYRGEPYSCAAPMLRFGREEWLKNLTEHFFWHSLTIASTSART